EEVQPEAQPLPPDLRRRSLHVPVDLALLVLALHLILQDPLGRAAGTPAHQHDGLLAEIDLLHQTGRVLHAEQFFNRLSVGEARELALAAELEAARGVLGLELERPDRAGFRRGFFRVLWVLARLLPRRWSKGQTPKGETEKRQSAHGKLP